MSQPFTLRLIKELGENFKIDKYVTSRSTLTNFKKHANNHGVIHLATHAETNNLNPELSKVVFTKLYNTENNDLYAYEIYNTDLTSNLTILTACETGKPSYQPGEGMISLAHAFNYAGSESMLTALWKVDEKASAQIIKSFYDHLAQGESKAVALQQAKLDYLKMADARTANPQYWAGLVLLGNDGTIDLKITTPLWQYVIIIVICVGAIAMFAFALWRKRIRKR